MELLSIFILWIRPAFRSRNTVMYLVLWAFTSSLMSLVAATEASSFFFILLQCNKLYNYYLTSLALLRVLKKNRVLAWCRPFCISYYLFILSLFYKTVAINRLLSSSYSWCGDHFGSVPPMAAIVWLASVVKYQTEFRHCRKKIFVRYSAIGRLWRHRSTLDISPPQVSRRGLTPRQNHHHFHANKKRKPILYSCEKIGGGGWKETELLLRRILQSFQRFFGPPPRPTFPSLHKHTHKKTFNLLCPMFWQIAAEISPFFLLTLFT